MKDLLDEFQDNFREIQENIRSHEAGITLEFSTVFDGGVEMMEDNPLEVAASAQKGVTDVISSVYNRLSENDIDTLSALLTANAEEIRKSDGIPLSRLNISFSCPALSKGTPATDISKLKPTDVDLIMAMGDSITAAFAEDFSNIFDGIKEYRGHSWSIGGDGSVQEGIITVANILKFYNPSLKGFSTGKNSPGRKENSNLNAAVSGAIVQDMNSQVDYLLATLNANHKTWKDQWKVLTIFIGGNNLCDACKGDAKDQTPAYETELRRVLTRLHDEMPKTFVNLVPVFKISDLYTVTHGNFFCDVLHVFECPCAQKSDETRKYIDTVAAGNAHAISLLGEEFKAKQTKDFAVVVQPFGAGVRIPDKTYLSPLDCFHPARIGHEGLAIGLWNNMITPASEKKSSWSPGDPLVCANPESLLYTH